MKKLILVCDRCNLADSSIKSFYIDRGGNINYFNIRAIGDDLKQIDLCQTCINDYISTGIKTEKKFI